MPRLDLNFEDLKPWCLYHNVHGCPCEKYKDPLEFGPDVNVSRNFAKRTLGNKFKTRKNAEKLVRKPSTTASESEVVLINEGIFPIFFSYFLKKYVSCLHLKKIQKVI